MKFRYETALASAPGRPCQDCVQVKDVGDGLVAALADGVGGMSGGEEAARWVVGQWLNEPGSAVDALMSYDDRLSRQRHGGQSTAILLRVGPAGIEGASVGDSCAWLRAESGEWLELTEHQRRKPYLGSAEAVPVGFTRILPTRGRLLVASDGLWRHANMDKVFALTSANAMLELPRLPLSKEFHDDVSILLVDW